VERSGRMVLLREVEGSNRSARIEVWVEAGRVGRVGAGGRADMVVVGLDDVRCWRRGLSHVNLVSRWDARDRIPEACKV
jgi:hypothetical protein